MLVRCFVLFVALYSVNCQLNISSVSPTWITSPYFRAGNKEVITTLTGAGVQPQFTFTFSSAMAGLPSLAYGIKKYRGNPYETQVTTTSDKSTTKSARSD